MEEGKYEMRIPAGVSYQMMVNLMKKFPDLELKQTDDGPVLLGEMKELDNARDYIVKALNERINELSGP